MSALWCKSSSFIISFVMRMFFNINSCTSSITKMIISSIEKIFCSKYSFVAQLTFQLNSFFCLMERYVITHAHDYEIFKSIVIFYTINMVNNFFFIKLSPNFILHKISMIWNFFTINSDHKISRAFNKIRLTYRFWFSVFMITITRAINYNSFLFSEVTSYLTRWREDFFAAITYKYHRYIIHTV